ncbi:MAG TPA: hypothetical protein VKG45_00875 [Actinomycetes bacterium]|nr:hypothetical protein [Actinomycetes bacterium]
MLELVQDFSSWTGDQIHDLMLGAWSPGMRVWGMDLPLRQLIGPGAGMWK